MSGLTVSIHQPQYLPWLGIIDKIARSDIFILLDSVQFSRHGFQHRTLYSTDRGQAYLSLAVRSKGHIDSRQTIAQTWLASSSITRKHGKTLKQRYGNCAGWRQFGEPLRQLLDRDWEILTDVNAATLEFTLAAFDIKTKVVRASDLTAAGKKTDLVLALAAEVGASRYLSGRGAQVYMDDAKFAAAGIQVAYQDFVHPTYSQLHSGPFVPGCFALEWLIEEGEGARSALRAHLARHPADAAGVETAAAAAGPANEAQI